MGFFYLVLLFVYLLASVLVTWLVRKFFRCRWLTVLTVIIAILFPTYDMIVQAVLLKYYDSTRTLQEIKRTVDAPGSVFWEDNVWPGYDKNYRLWMIDHLLDGKHLHTLAMNGPDGEIYLYRYGKGDTPEIYNDAHTLPPFNYHVVLNPIPLPWWQKKFLWADRMEIIDNRTKELIAYSERYMGYSPRAYVVKIRGIPFEAGGKIGETLVYGFDDRILFRGKRPLPAPEGARCAFRRWLVSDTLANYVKKRGI